MATLQKELNYYMELPYKIEVTPVPEEEGGGYMAVLPEIGKEAIVGDGDTVEEACRNLREIQKELFSDYLQRNIKIPEPDSSESYSGKFVLRIPKILHKELDQMARQENVSLNLLVNHLLSQAAERMQLINEFSSDMAFHFNFLKNEIQALTFQVKNSSKRQGDSVKIDSLRSYGSDYIRAA